MNSFWQREKRMKKMNSTLLFSVKEQSLETRKLRKPLAKEEEEEVEEDVQRDSKVVKEYIKFIEMQVKVFKKTIRRVITF